MRALNLASVFSLVFLAGLVGAARTACAQDSTESRLKALEQKIQQQDEEIQRLHDELGSQKDATSSLSHEVDAYLGKESDESWWSEPNTLRASWGNGLRLASSDKQFTLALGGRLMYDIAAMDPASALEDAYGRDAFRARGEFRRVRMYMGGTIYGAADYKVEMDFAGAKVAFKDVLVGVKGDFGAVHIGHQYEPIGLENLTSDNYITFIERAPVSDLQPERTTGIRYDNTFADGTVSFAAGWFFDEAVGTTDGASGNGVLANNITARATWAPILKEKGEELLHLGAGVSFRNPRDGMYKIGMHPEVHVAPTVAAASFSDLEDATIVNFEVAYTTGPLSAQAEYCIMTTSSSAMDDPTLTAFYIAANYFLTGEHRTYSKGAFGRLKGPAHNFLDGQAGTGAWQVGIRYSMADLNDKNLVGGELSDITLGVNWYINPNTRVMVDYVHSNIKNKSMSLDDALNAVYFRFAVDF